jgi:hypothetical protein
LSTSTTDSSLSTLKDNSHSSTHLPSVDKKSLSIVSLQQTSIAPKESVTYEKQTQTIAQSNERGGILNSFSLKLTNFKINLM